MLLVINRGIMRNMLVRMLLTQVALELSFVVVGVDMGCGLSLVVDNIYGLKGCVNRLVIRNVPSEVRKVQQISEELPYEFV